jgi:tyrosinase
MPGGARVASQGAIATRRSIRTMAANDPDLAAYRRAVASMKALPRSDPRNWFRFAEIHRDHCPHSNWYFLPWHRAYLLALERLCRQLSGKADFALPYWDWTLDRQVPAAFTAGDRNSNPLNHPRPGMPRGASLPDDMVGRAVISRIMQSPDFEAFGSGRPSGQNSADPQWQQRPGASTELEFNPHAGVHRSIGGDMGVVGLASLDPIFYLHHANVDRLWMEWNRRGNANSPEPMWRDFAFEGNFANPDGTPWDITVGDLGTTPALGYRYDDDDGPFAADVALPTGDVLAERLRAYRQFGPDLLACATGGQSEIPLRSGGAIYMAMAENRQTATRDRPIGISVPLGRPLGGIVGSGAMAYRPDRPGRVRDRRYVWAVLRDIAPPPDASTRVRVFCNCQELSPRTRLDDPSYTTSLSFFGGHHGGRGTGGHHGGRTAHGVSACIDLTPVLARMNGVLRSDRLTVQLLPMCASSESRASAVRPRCVEIVVI